MKFADVIFGQKRALPLSHPDVSIYHDLQEGALEPSMVMLSAQCWRGAKRDGHSSQCLLNKHFPLHRKLCQRAMTLTILEMGCLLVLEDREQYCCIPCTNPH